MLDLSLLLACWMARIDDYFKRADAEKLRWQPAWSSLIADLKLLHVSDS